MSSTDFREQRGAGDIFARKVPDRAPTPSSQSEAPTPVPGGNSRPSTDQTADPSGAFTRPLKAL